MTETNEPDAEQAEDFSIDNLRMTLAGLVLENQSAEKLLHVQGIELDGFAMLDERFDMLLDIIFPTEVHRLQFEIAWQARLKILMKTQDDELRKKQLTKGISDGKKIEVTGMVLREGVNRKARRAK